VINTYFVIAVDYIVRINWSCWWMGEHIISWRWEFIRTWLSKYTVCWYCWTKYSSFGQWLMFVNKK